MSEALLFDTSVWIDFLNKKSTPEADLLVHYIEKDEQVLLTPAIIQEVLQGIREDFKYKKIKEILSYFTVLELPAVRAAVGAADLYRSLRKKGTTIRKSNDCLIAYYALEFSITLVHSDADFDKFNGHSNLKIKKF